LENAANTAELPAWCAPGAAFLPAAATLHLRTSLVHIQGPATEVRAIQGLDRPVGVCIRHLDEREPARPPGIPVSHQLDALHRPLGFEQFSDGIFRGPEIQIAYEYLLHVAPSMFDGGLFEAETAQARLCGTIKRNFTLAILLYETFLMVQRSDAATSLGFRPGGVRRFGPGLGARPRGEISPGD